jgi:hypothetical protein
MNTVYTWLIVSDKVKENIGKKYTTIIYYERKTRNNGLFKVRLIGIE